MSDFVRGLDAAIGEAMVLSSPNEMALAAIRYIEKAGHRIVPVEPTEEMCRAGFAADFDGQPLVHPIWKAMLAAAPKVTP